MKYNFKTAKSHYIKHVLGKDPKDDRDKSFIKRESLQWENKHISEPDKMDLYEKNIFSYVKVAIDNKENAKRKYFYKDKFGNVSKNYQKEDCVYDKSMIYDEKAYEGLLTTCLDYNNNIKSCFYRTLGFNNIEVLSMALAIFESRNNPILVAGTIHIDGFKLEGYAKSLRDFFQKMYEEYLEIPQTSIGLAIKAVSIELLDENLKRPSIKEEHYLVLYDLLKKIINEWKKAYKEEKPFEASKFINFDYDSDVLNKFKKLNDDEGSEGIFHTIYEFLNNTSSMNSLLKLFKISKNEYLLDNKYY